jgi:hypothetical protein
MWVKLYVKVRKVTSLLKELVFFFIALILKKESVIQVKSYDLGIVDGGETYGPCQRYEALILHSVVFLQIRFN